MTYLFSDHVVDPELKAMHQVKEVAMDRKAGKRGRQQLSEGEEDGEVEEGEQGQENEEDE